MGPLTIEQVQAAIDEAVARIGVTRGGWRPFVADHVDRDSGYPFFWIDGATLHYENRERGRTLRDRTTTELDELVGWVVSDVARELASSEELLNRRPGEDSRRQLFARWVVLATRVDPQYGDRVQTHVDAVLVEAPYRDD